MSQPIFLATLPCHCQGPTGPRGYDGNNGVINGTPNSIAFFNSAGNALTGTSSATLNPTGTISVTSVLANHGILGGRMITNITTGGFNTTPFLTQGTGYTVTSTQVTLPYPATCYMVTCTVNIVSTVNVQGSIFITAGTGTILLGGITQAFGPTQSATGTQNNTLILTCYLQPINNTNNYISLTLSNCTLNTTIGGSSVIDVQRLL